jgi:Carboxypeptidase regulatory-like domain
MRWPKTVALLIGMTLLLITASAQDRSLGGIKGKVRVETGSPAGVAVIVRQEDREVTRATTDRHGDFVIQRLAPGSYGLTFRKPGLSVGSIENFSVRAGEVRSLGDHVVLGIDEGSIAFLRGSVFDESGRSFPNAKVELARILEDGSLKKMDSRITNETGQFVFRLNPDTAKYRVTAKADHMQTASQDVPVDSAVVYRIALSLVPVK